MSSRRPRSGPRCASAHRREHRHDGGAWADHGRPSVTPTREEILGAIRSEGLSGYRWFEDATNETDVVAVQRPPTGGSSSRRTSAQLPSDAASSRRKSPPWRTSSPDCARSTAWPPGTRRIARGGPRNAARPGPGLSRVPGSGCLTTDRKPSRRTHRRLRQETPRPRRILRDTSFGSSGSTGSWCPLASSDGVPTQPARSTSTSSTSTHVRPTPGGFSTAPSASRSTPTWRRYPTRRPTTSSRWWLPERKCRSAAAENAFRGFDAPISGVLSRMNSRMKQ